MKELVADKREQKPIFLQKEKKVKELIQILKPGVEFEKSFNSNVNPTQDKYANVYSFWTMYDTKVYIMIDTLDNDLCYIRGDYSRLNHHKNDNILDILYHCGLYHNAKLQLVKSQYFNYVVKPSQVIVDYMGDDHIYSVFNFKDLMKFFEQSKIV
jgi:hypothetical protein